MLRFDRYLVIALIVLLVFCISFLFSFKSPFEMPELGLLSVPFIITYLIIDTSAMFIGGLTCYQSADIFSCNDQIITILYFFFSVFYSIVLYLMIKPLGKRSKLVLAAFILKPNIYKLMLVLLFVSLLLITSGVNSISSAIKFTSIYILPFIIPVYLTICLIFYLTRIFRRMIFNK